MGPDQIHEAAAPQHLALEAAARVAAHAHEILLVSRPERADQAAARGELLEQGALVGVLGFPQPIDALGEVRHSPLLDAPRVRGAGQAQAREERGAAQPRRDATARHTARRGELARPSGERARAHDVGAPPFGPSWMRSPA